MKIDFFKHNIEEEDIQECIQVLRSIFLTTGSVVSEFESKFAEFTGNEYAIGVNSCTDALFLTLKCIDLHPGDEVITTPMSFIATSNVIEHCGATPVFVDVEKDTGNIDASKIEEKITKKTKAILVVHLYGLMCDMKTLRSIADKHKLFLIEDSAHCIEGERDGIKPGNLGDFACFSFYATKNITSGEGGAITCHKEVYAEWLRKARSHGMSKNAAQRYTKKYEHYEMEFLGYKANMTNIQASLLLHQLGRIHTYRIQKEKICQRYTAAFNKLKTVRLLKTPKSTIHAHHLYTLITLDNRRDDLLNFLQDQGIGVAVNYRPIHLMAYYKNKYRYKVGDFPIAENIGNCTITLPLYSKLTTEEITYLTETIQKYVANKKR